MKGKPPQMLKPRAAYVGVQQPTRLCIEIPVLDVFKQGKGRGWKKEREREAASAQLGYTVDIHVGSRWKIQDRRQVKNTLKP